MAITSNIRLSLKFKESFSNGALEANLELLKSVVNDIDNVDLWAFAVGTDGAGQAIAGGGTDTYDTSGSLTTAVNVASSTMSRMIYLYFENVDTTTSMTLTVNNYNGTSDLIYVARPGGVICITDENNQEPTNVLGDITVVGTAGKKYKLIFAGNAALYVAP